MSELIDGSWTRKPSEREIAENAFQFPVLSASPPIEILEIALKYSLRQARENGNVNTHHILVQEDEFRGERTVRGVMTQCGFLRGTNGMYLN